MNDRIKELETEICEALQRMNRPQYTIEDHETNNAHQEAIIALCERELKELRQTKVEKPCDGFELAKPSKAKALLLAPILAVCGWLCLLYLISRR